MKGADKLGLTNLASDITTNANNLIENLTSDGEKVIINLR